MNYNWNQIVEMARANRAKKAASDNRDLIMRTAELFSIMAEHDAKTAADDPCTRSLRRKLAADLPGDPMSRIKGMLDAKIASDPKLRILGILGRARQRKEASQRGCETKPARTVVNQIAARAPEGKPELPLEGQEKLDEGRTVTFGDGRTVTFPASQASPVKSAADKMDAGLKNVFVGILTGSAMGAVHGLVNGPRNKPNIGDFTPGGSDVIRGGAAGGIMGGIAGLGIGKLRADV